MITYPELVKRLAKPGEQILKELTPLDCHLWHMASCIPSEAGELFDAVKKQVIYRKPLDRANVVEELGDLEFYMQGLREAYGITREETLAANIAKLSKRYEQLSYSDKAAEERADKEKRWECSVCHEINIPEKLTACDNCGAKREDKDKPKQGPSPIVHFLRGGVAACGKPDVPKANYKWSSFWERVTCPDCREVHKDRLYMER